MAEHEKTKTAPGGEVIRQLFPKDKPCLRLLDELMNYVSRTRGSPAALSRRRRGPVRRVASGCLCGRRVRLGCQIHRVLQGERLL